jgi:hypothetical protein
LHSTRLIPKSSPCPNVEVSLFECRDRDFQTLTNVLNRIAKELAFGCVNQGMRRKDFGEGRQGAARSQEHCATRNWTSPRLQIADHLFEGIESQAL